MAPPLPKRLHRKLQTDGNERSSRGHIAFHMALRARLVGMLPTSRNGLAHSHGETKPPFVTFTAGQESISHNTQGSRTIGIQEKRAENPQTKMNQKPSNQLRSPGVLAAMAASSSDQLRLRGVCGF